MRFTNAFVFLLAVSILPIHSAIGQVVSKFTVVYAIELENVKGMDEQAAAMMKNATTEVAYDGKFTRVVNNVAMTKSTITTNNETQNSLMLVEALGQVMAIEMDADQLDRHNERTDSEMEVTVTEETEEILDEECTKVILTPKDGGDGSVTMYIAEGITAAGKGFKYTYPGVSGLPLRIETTVDGGTYTMNAISFEKSVTGAFSTTPPPNAQVLDFGMYQEMQNFMKR